MSSVMNVALQLTAVDMMQGIIARAKNAILSLGDASGKVKRDFDDMTRHKYNSPGYHRRRIESRKSMLE